jgi:hypothetical protein
MSNRQPMPSGPIRGLCFWAPLGAFQPTTEDIAQYLLERAHLIPAVLEHLGHERCPRCGNWVRPSREDIPTTYPTHRLPWGGACVAA